ncbi:hypothetical protein Dimus_018905 [Dionaea muscipula]
MRPKDGKFGPDGPSTIRLRLGLFGLTCRWFHFHLAHYTFGPWRCFNNISLELRSPDQHYNISNNMYHEKMGNEEKPEDKEDGSKEKSKASLNKTLTLSPLSSNPPSKLDILRHNRNPLSMNGTQVCILKDTNKVSLGGLLEGGDSGALEPEIGFEVLSDLPHQPLEREFPDQELRALLVLPDLPQRHRPWAEPVGFLHTAGRWGGLAGCLGRQLLPWGFSSGGFPRCLLGASH